MWKYVKSSALVDVIMIVRVAPAFECGALEYLNASFTLIAPIFPLAKRNAMHAIDSITRVDHG